MQQFIYLYIWKPWFNGVVSNNLLSVGNDWHKPNVKYYFTIVVLQGYPNYGSWGLFCGSWRTRLNVDKKLLSILHKIQYFNPFYPSWNHIAPISIIYYCMVAGMNHIYNHNWEVVFGSLQASIIILMQHFFFWIIFQLWVSNDLCSKPQIFYSPRWLTSILQIAYRSFIGQSCIICFCDITNVTSYGTSLIFLLIEIGKKKSHQIKRDRMVLITVMCKHIRYIPKWINYTHFKHF